MLGGKEEHFGGGVVLTFAHGFYFENFKVPVGKLAFKFGISSQRVLGVEAVEIEMGMAVAPTGPEEAVGTVGTGFQDSERVLTSIQASLVSLRTLRERPELASMK